MINKVESFILYLFSFLFFVSLFAQREGDNRIFRKNLGINFNDDKTHSFFEPNSDTLVAKNYYHYGAVPCISDSEGNLQFYEWQPEIEYADSIITDSFLQPEWEKIKEEIPGTSSQTYESKVKDLPLGVYLLKVETDARALVKGL